MCETESYFSSKKNRRVRRLVNRAGGGFEEFYEWRRTKYPWPLNLTHPLQSFLHRHIPSHLDQQSPDVRFAEAPQNESPQLIQLYDF